MRKKIVVLLLIGVLILSLIGCGKDIITKGGNSSNINRFVDTGDRYVIGDVRCLVYYDNITKIVYVVDNGVNRGGLSIMYDANKQPMTLDEYNKTK